MTTKVFITTVVMAMFVTTIARAQEPLHVKVEKPESAAKQLAYARQLVARASATKGRPPAERHSTVAAAASNLEAVARAFPHDHDAIVEANALLAALYVDAEMPQNAIDAANSGLTIAPNDHRLWLAIGQAQARLGHSAEAAAAFARADQTFVPRRGADVEDVAALNRIAFSYERQHDYARSANAMRRAASLDDASPLTRLLFRQRALELTLHTPDRGLARKDLEAFRAAYTATLGVSRNPAEQAAINQAATALERYEAMLK